MAIAVRLAAIALREVAGSAGEAIGYKVGGMAIGAAVDFLIQRFTDQSHRLSDALELANGRAWQAVEIALAGDSFWDRCKVALTRGEDQAFRRQVRAFLDITPLAGLPSHGPEFRQQCLREIRAARAAGLLTDGSLAPDELARQAGAFAGFTGPQALLDAETQAVAGLAEEFRAAGYPAVAQLLSLEPSQGMPLLVLAARYFFRREVETNQQLFQGLAWAKLERLDKAQESGFTALAVAFATQGQRLEEMLGDVRSIVEETHGGVLRIEEEVRRHGRQVQELGDAVLRLLEQHRLQERSLQPRDSFSIRGEDERRLVRHLVSRYRALPEDERRQMPGLLNGVGKLEVLAGDFEAAQHDFETAAALAPVPTAKAEAALSRLPCGPGTARLARRSARTAHGGRGRPGPLPALPPGQVSARTHLGRRRFRRRLPLPPRFLELRRSWLKLSRAMGWTNRWKRFSPRPSCCGNSITRP